LRWFEERPLTTYSVRERIVVVDKGVVLYFRALSGFIKLYLDE
jgi:hypothetical protein